ncbi:zinc-binding dehydrogenase [Pseudonocardia spinosispora]|uniref:zinc-binding dehydrogenase n=1 Tax=Pseudonocardia spinosispora TaxID=103441 RepID=UPI000401CCB7|nr:zinc-binding dehydrogenase [Pseudonocardia spinosispora]
MRMMQVDEFGGPEVFRMVTAPDLVAGPGHVVIDVVVAGVLSVDAMIRRGEGGDYFTVRPPYVPGAGVAGQVRSVGDGVAGEWVGRRVLAALGGGGYASQVTATESALIPVPDGLGLDTAVALLHDGATALGVLERTPVRRGDTVLIQPAAGGLGTLLVQLAHRAGAYVIGAARGAHKLELITELGADLAVDYSEPGWLDRLPELDVVFDGVGAQLGRAAFSRVVVGGRYSNYGRAGGSPIAIPPAEARARGVSTIGMEQLADLAAELHPRAAGLLHEAAAGRLRPIISRTYPLEQAARAHAAIEAREVLGKSLLVP